MHASSNWKWSSWWKLERINTQSGLELILIKEDLGGGGAICWTWRLFQSSYLNAGKMQVHDTGRVKTETQDQEKQDQQGPVRERANVAVRSADSGIFPHAFLLMVSWTESRNVLWNHQQIDQARKCRQDQRDDHGADEMVVTHLVVLGKGRKVIHRFWSGREQAPKAIASRLLGLLHQ